MQVLRSRIHVFSSCCISTVLSRKHITPNSTGHETDVPVVFPLLLIHQIFLKIRLSVFLWLNRCITVIAMSIKILGKETVIPNVGLSLTVVEYGIHHATHKPRTWFPNRCFAVAYAFIDTRRQGSYVQTSLFRSNAMMILEPLLLALRSWRTRL